MYDDGGKCMMMVITVQWQRVCGHSLAITHPLGTLMPLYHTGGGRIHSPVYLCAYSISGVVLYLSTALNDILYTHMAILLESYQRPLSYPSVQYISLGHTHGYIICVKCRRQIRKY